MADEIIKKQQADHDVSEELSELERYIEELSTFLPLPFCIVNPTGMILNINKAFSDLTGYGDLEIVGGPVNRLFKNESEAQALEERVLKEDFVRNQEIALMTEKGETVDVNVSSSLRKDRENNIIGYFLAFSDISELKKLQKNLEKKVEERTAQLREKIEELERFNNLAVGREMKMVELKQEIESLKSQLEKKKDS